MLIDKEPSLVQDIEESLHNEGLGSNLFYLREDGKHYGLFKRYVVDTPGYFIHTDSTSEGTTVYLNDNEIGVLDKAKEAQEFGPFLAGSYKVKGMKKSAAGSTEDEVVLELAGTKIEKEITLNTGNSEEETEKEEVKEKTVVKEVIREVAPKSSQASYSYYLIPHSDYAYLTYDDLSGLSKSELRLARNEIYARHGYIFNSKDLQNYFSSQSWYSPNPGYGGSLSSVEKHNVDFIKSFE
ncbi:YARHG domain-containing protein [Bacillus sp. PK3_68]|uniref:YARHG domain-containing protein n=1 Tax=Bacillus sp. PK3_68 TaxID=2027408 RepID=UPI000E720C1C|nr:YARHG domain-containing protein [Bacillus sp. PK3_68]RJS60615.1 hypothetical protein CJ483_11465 [Bacillus sp. PK3_68]